MATIKKQRDIRTVGIIGLGYVGLPLAVLFAKRGLKTTGFDVDASKVSSIKRGRSYIGDVTSPDLARQVKCGKLTATTDFAALKKQDAIIICVPTPLRKTKDPDISFIASATEKIRQNLRKGQLIILESTTYPGTTRDCVLPELEKTGLKAGKDFLLAFSPERVDPSNERFTIENTPKVVGGITPACTRAAAALYSKIICRVVPVSSTETAELVKLLENTFRAVNIGLVNEMALVCDRLGINVWEVIQAAATKPYGFMPFYPGPGLGGHCIPVDPHYLSWKMRALNFSTRFIDLAGEVNSHMPEFVLERIERALNDRRKALNGSKILLLGVAYKADVSDVRESPALDVIHLLHQKHSSIAYHDPFVPSVEAGGLTLKSRPLTNALLRSMDAVVILTGHRTFDPRTIVQQSKLVIDTRNITQGLKSPKIICL